MIICKQTGTSFIEAIDWDDSFVECGFYGAFLLRATKCVRACVHARVHACVSKIPKSSDYLLLFFHLSTFFHTSPFSPSFSSSREPFAGSERSSSPAAINLFRDELSHSSGLSLGLAILRFRDSSKEHPLGVRVRS